MGMREANDNASGLKAHPLGSLETIAIIIGTNIGAGVLSMAYAARKVGYVPLLVCLALTCLFCIVTMLYVTEACLRTAATTSSAASPGVTWARSAAG